MSLLILDTATEKSQVILADSPTDFEVRELTAVRCDLFTALESWRGQVSALAVNLGPGSYIGVRTALAAAYAIAVSGDIPIVGFPALLGFVAEEEGPFLSLIDARGAGAHLWARRRVGQQIQAEGEPMTVSLDQLPAYLHRARTVVGPALSRFDLLTTVERYADPAVLITYSQHVLAEGASSYPLPHYQLPTPAPWPEENCFGV